MYFVMLINGLGVLETKYYNQFNSGLAKSLINNDGYISVMVYKHQEPDKYTYIGGATARNISPGALYPEHQADF